jgi:hypothetical protein
MKHAPIGDRMAALFGLGALAFSPPLLAIFAKPEMVNGIPLLYLYLFGIWAVLIVLLAYGIRRRRAEEPAAPPDQTGDG